MTGINQRYAVIAHLDALAAIETGEATCRLVLVDLEAGRYAGEMCVAARDWEKRTDVFSLVADGACPKVTVPVEPEVAATPASMTPPPAEISPSESNVTDVEHPDSEGEPIVGDGAGSDASLGRVVSPKPADHSGESHVRPSPTSDVAPSAPDVQQPADASEVREGPSEAQQAERKAELVARYKALPELDRKRYWVRAKQIDTDDLDAVAMLLDEIEPRPDRGDRATCSSCGAPIKWAVTEKGARIPLDAKPVENGNVHVYDGVAYVYPAGALPLDDHREHGDKLYVSHFATCPNADQHRKRNKASTPDEGGPADKASVARLRATHQALEPEASAWVNSLVSEGKAAGVSWSPGVDATVRRFELGRAVIKICKAYHSEFARIEVCRGLLGAATGREEVEQETIPLGAAIGSLNHLEAAAFARIVDTATSHLIDPLTA